MQVITEYYYYMAMIYISAKFDHGVQFIYANLLRLVAPDWQTTYELLGPIRDIVKTNHHKLIIQNHYSDF